MTPEYASETVRRFFDQRGPYGEIMKVANVPSSMVIIQRINLGLYAVFGELRARGSWRRLSEEIWPLRRRPAGHPHGRGRGRLAGRAPRHRASGGVSGSAGATSGDGTGPAGSLAAHG